MSLSALHPQVSCCHRTCHHLHVYTVRTRWSVCSPTRGKHCRGRHLDFLVHCWIPGTCNRAGAERMNTSRACLPEPFTSLTHPPSQWSLDGGGFFKEEVVPQSCQVICSGPWIRDRASQWSGPLGYKDYPLGLAVVIQLLSHVQLCDPKDCSPPGSMGFFRQEYCSGLPFLSPGDHPGPGIKSCLQYWQAGSLPLTH